MLAPLLLAKSNLIRVVADATLRDCAFVLRTVRTALAAVRLRANAVRPYGNLRVIIGWCGFCGRGYGFTITLLSLRDIFPNRKIFVRPYTGAQCTPLRYVQIFAGGHGDPPLRFVVHCSVAPQSIMPRCLPCSRVLRYRQNLLFLRVLHPRQFPLFPLPSALRTASSPFHPRKCASRAHPWTGAQTR